MLRWIFEPISPACGAACFQGKLTGPRGNTMKIPRAVRLLAFGLLLLIIPAALSSPSAAQIGVGVSVRIGPPALPIYEQPICPGPGYLWTPGYWAWDDDDGYYWVPGTWVVAPVGELWTPGYWGWGEGVYLWHVGYWGPHIGFYGGINYGFGYGGEGFYGGEWRGGAFFYNTAVTRVNTVNITNVYVNRTVIVNNNSHVAFNGGQGGVQARPSPAQEAFARQTHTPPVAAQVRHEHAASQNKTLFASNNHGRPAVAATARPADFSGRGVVKAKAAGAPYHAPSISPKQARATPSAGNHAAANRPADNRPAGKAPSPSGSKAANRPFVPPNKSNTTSSAPARTESANRTNNNRPNSTRPSESHAAKPFTPPPSSHASTSSHASSTPRAQSSPRTETARSSSPSRPSRQQAAPSHESRPQSAPHPAPQARESAPHASAPRPQRESAPPRHEAPPKPEHKGR
jgi:hypothetical protein